MNVGDRFGRLTTISKPSTEKGRKRVAVTCDCGAEKLVRVDSLLSGRTTSCGCLRVQIVSRHGSYKTRLYRLWSGMLSRCRNDRPYVERGITVCDEWHDFESFRQWASEAGYPNGLTIDRIDNAKGYSPDNCRFASYTVQNQNRRKPSNNTSGYIGVYKLQGGWRARARRHKQTVHLGVFDDPVEAAQARDTFVRKHYESPTLNFPEEVKA